MNVRRAITTVGATALALAVGLTPALPAGAAKPKISVLATGLNSPKGLAAIPGGDLVIGQGAFGPPAPTVVLALAGKDRGTLTPVTDPANLVDVAISPLDGTGWGLGPTETSVGVLFHQLADGSVVEVLDVGAYQATDPDPFDNEDIPTESNPYGLTVMANGDALVADAANNDVIRVTPDGDAWTVARFDIELVSTAHLPPEAGFPPMLPAESVPTAVTIGPDGAIYVGELKGFPFAPGSSRVWRVAPDAEGAVCSVNTPDAACTTYTTGLTAIQDIAFNQKSGKLWVLELAADGVLAFEEGFTTGVFPAAVLVGVKNGPPTEVAAGQLSQPGGLVATNDGKLYVTDQVFGDGRVSFIRP